MQLDYRNITPGTFTAYILALNADNQRAWRDMDGGLKADVAKALGAFAEDNGIALPDWLAVPEPPLRTFARLALKRLRKAKATAAP